MRTMMAETNRSTVLRERGFHLDESAGEVDGRPIEAYHDFIVLAPYHHLWLHA